MPKAPRASLRTAIVSFHSHGDRSFLDDRHLAVASGELRDQGIDNDLVVVFFPGGARAVSEPEEVFDRLVERLTPYDVIVYERVWSRDLVERLRARLAQKTFVHLRGEHRLEDPPADHVCESDLVSLMLQLRRGESTPASSGVAQLRRGKPRFAPNLKPIVVNPELAPPHRSFAVFGNTGCPYQNDARDNPRFAGVDIPAGYGKGCGFCTTGNHYDGRPNEVTLESVLEQLRYVRREATDLELIVLKDQNPFGYLTELMARAAVEGIAPFTLMLETRADWFLRNRARFERALEHAGRGGHTIAPYLVGIENFSQAELDRFNKGTTAETNEEFLLSLRVWRERFGPAMSLDHAAFGFVLFSPWTTFEDLEANARALGRTRFDELRGKILLSRVRLYPDTALYYLAKRDGLVVEEYASAGDDSSARYGYYPAHPWRFRDDRVAHFASLAARASERANGHDELRIFDDLLDRFRAAGDDYRTVDLPAARTPRRALPVAISPSREGSMDPPTARARRLIQQVHLGGDCGLRCAPCDCHAEEREPRPLSGRLRGGGARLVVRGAPDASEDLDVVLQTARDEGFGEVVMRTPAVGYGSARDAVALRDRGVDGVMVPLFSHVAKVHDKIAGRDGTLVRALVGMRSLADAGLFVEVEVPLLPANLQRPVEVLNLAHRAVEQLRAIRFFVPQHPLPAALTPPAWSEAAPALAEALDRASELGVRAEIVANSDGIPFCALKGFERHLERHYRFDPSGKRRPAVGRHVDECEECSLKRQCPGVPGAYFDAHGSRDVARFERKPRGLFDAQRTTPRRRWTEDEKRGAKGATVAVLRPTVNCNQDCGFCSANETSNNVWENPERMLRVIARAARRGVDHLSFSGGEPTLSRHLGSFVRAASRLGIPKVEVVTNAVLLDRPGKVAALREAGLTHAFVSLHAHTEELSRRITQKKGDFDRTARGIELLVDAGAQTSINHVINAMNYRYLTRFVEFVAERFDRRAPISFAFVTPQYKALQHIEIVPRLSDAMPFLKQAMYRAMELEQPFIVGSRQGVPPCFLGEFAGWSDIFDISNEAQAEDAFQKTRAPGCDECRYSSYCLGLWKPYVHRYGLDEVEPVRGPAFAPDDADAGKRILGYPVPRTFEAIHESLRRPELERSGRGFEVPVVEVAGPDLALTRTRPVRALIVGSGGQARRLAGAARNVSGLSIDAVASPHAPDASGAEFGDCPTYRSVQEALEDIRPEAAIIAASTHAHEELVRTCIEHRVPVLVEKPVTGSSESAAALSSAAREAGVLAVPVHQLVHAAGIDRLAGLGGARLSVTARYESGSRDIPTQWSRSALYESLYHLLSLAAYVAGAELTRAECVQAEGASGPERLRFELDYGPLRADLGLETGAAVTDLRVESAGRTWVRHGRSTTIDYGSGPTPLEQVGADLVAVLSDFTAAVRDESPPRITLDDGVRVVRAAAIVLDALEATGVFARGAAAPRHAASRGLAPGYD